MKTEDCAIFTELVCARMKARGISLRELCRQTGVDPSYLSKVFGGKRNPPWESVTLEAMAKVLDIPEPELFLSVGKMPSSWKKLQTDKALFRTVTSLIDGRPGAPAYERERIPAGLRDGAAPAIPDELL